MKCSICGKEYNGFGNNSAPLQRGYCCDECNHDIVVPLRIYLSGIVPNQLLTLTENGEIKFSEPMEEAKLERLQKEVDGYIEIYPKRNDKFLFIVDEEGLLKHKFINELAMELFGIKAVGNVVVCPKNLMK